MQLIKLDATASTNVYLKELMQEASLADFTIVIANEQLNGKGQMGSSWQSEKGKNLTFSVLKHHANLNVRDQFYLNMVVSLAIFKTLNSFKIPDIHIKWPNDILSGKNKICGILIENIFFGQKITSSVIGIGLNVNQTQFAGLPNVSSLQLLKGKNFDLDEVLNLVVKNLEKLFIDFEKGLQESLKEAYLNVLFRKDKVSTFTNLKNNELFTGIIRNVSEEGKLIVQVEDEILKSFDLKEVKLMY